MSEAITIIRLCPEHLCEVFWNEALIDRLDSREWTEKVRRSSKGGEGKAFVPFRDYAGNWIVETQEVAWIEVASGQERVRLQKYITDRGTIGGSGYPDPKRIRLGPNKNWSLTNLVDSDNKKFKPCDKCGRTDHQWPHRPPREK